VSEAARTSEAESEPVPPSIGPTAIMSGLVVACPSCALENQPELEACAHCGTSMPRREIVSGATSGGAVVSAPTSARSAWVEGPESGAGIANDPTGDGPAISRRGAMPSYDEIPAPIADPLIGVVVAERYRILEPLGRGGMGAVYKVEHTRIGKLLAMKLLTGELSRNPDVVRRFKQEALTASKLSSPNTVQVFDFGVAEGLTYLVMELVAGEDLGRTLRTGGPLRWERLGKIVIQICSSLAEAHGKGIVHRDIKPENVMLMRARDGTDLAKVLDFGLAKLRESTELNEVTSQGAIVGTPYFMSPEQVRGEPVDARTDVYALGALMYRALTGYYPFSGPTPMSVFTKHLTEPVVAPIDRAPELGIPPGLSALVVRALAKAPSDRFARIEDLQHALVEEMRAIGTSSVETLLDSGQLRRLQKVAATVPMPSGTRIAPAVVELATRDEVEAYERKLRRQKYGAYVIALAVVVVSSGVAARLALHETVQFRGVEVEPNNTVGDATEVPEGKRVTGYLGRRIDITRPDRDFFAVTVPSVAADKPTIMHLGVTSLPNFATCTLLYKQGFSTPLGQYCVGRPSRDLDIGALELEPGRYFLAVTQDLDPYGRTAPFVHENVSDPYTITFERAGPEPDHEIEPNDQIASANIVQPGTSMTGVIGWSRDEDMYCVPDGAPAIRWRVKDATRDQGTVLEATPMKSADEGVSVRVHSSGKGKESPTDAASPWTSTALAPIDGVRRCLRVRLASDPWSGSASSMVPNGGSEAYVVQAEPVP
jgi:serine/threonine-protein kinase